MTTERDAVAQGVSRSRRFSLFWLVTVVAFLGILALGWWWSRQKSVGLVSSPVIPEDMIEASAGVERYEGRFGAFSFSREYDLRTESQEVLFPILERAVFSRNDVEGRKLVYLVQDITNLSLEEYPSYRIRDLDKEAYQKQISDSNGKRFTFFSKNTTVFEVGAFWQEGARAYSLIISSPIRSSGLREELETILDSYQTVKGS